MSIRIFRKIYNTLGIIRWNYCYGFSLTAAKIYAEFSNDDVTKAVKQNEAVVKYLKRRNRDLIEKWKFSEFVPGKKEESKPIIWIMWWSGEEEMPETAKVCQQNVNKFAPEYKVVLLDKNNVRQYCDLPDYVWKQFDEGKLKIQHLADMIRVNVIYNHGGIWLDASIYCKKQVISGAKVPEFYTIKGNKDGFEGYVSLNQWTTFAIGGQKHNVLFGFLNDLFINYCKSGRPFLYYYMFDCAIALAYREINSVRKTIDNYPKTDGNCYWLEEHLEERVTDKLLEEYKNEPSACYKLICGKRHNGENTLYGYIEKENQ